MLADACPDDQRVADFVTRRATPEDAGAIEAHIDRCASCRELVSALVQATVPARPGALAAGAGGGARGRHPLEGTAIGRFTVAERLGAGGMGAVYAAHDPVLDRRVALKILHDADGGVWTGRLLREAQALARLGHPNVVAVYDVGEHDGQVFIAMELVDGMTLSAWLGLKPPLDSGKALARDWRDIVEKFVQAGRGLAAAHAAGFVHRDFKPDNVLVGDDGRARVTDFGLARLGDAPDAAPPPHALVEEITRTGTVVGTPAYMAPEQLDGRATDARADQFAFCVALFEALTGARPYRGDHVVELRAAIALGPPAEVRCDAPARVRRAVRRGLAEAPAARHLDMVALLAELHLGPARRLRTGALFAGVALIVGASAWRAGRGAASSSSADPCGGADAALVGVWDPAVRERGAAGFAASQLPYAADTWRTTAAALDRWTAAWTAAHVDACGDTAIRREQSADMLDRRMSCLDQQLGELRALTSTFAPADTSAAGPSLAGASTVGRSIAAADASVASQAIGAAVTGDPPVGGASATVVEHAVAAVGALADPAACSDLAALAAPDGPPADPALRRRVQAIDRALAAAHAAWSLGKIADAATALERLEAEATALGHPPTLARVQLRRGLVLATLDEAGTRPALAPLRAPRASGAATSRGARDVLRGAARTAEIARMDGARGDALIALVELAARDVYKPGLELDAALALADDAAAVIERLGGDRRLRQAQLATGRGEALRAAGLPERAVQELGAAVMLVEPLGDARALELAQAVLRLGSAQHDLGRLDDAAASTRRALALLERTLGPTHPEVGDALHSLGLTVQTQGDLPAARASFERAIAIYEAVHGRESLPVARSLAGLADTLTYLGSPADAVPHLERAMAIFERLKGQPSPDMLDSLGRARGALGELDDALALHRRALDVRRATLPPDDRDLALSQLNLGHQYLASGRFADAIPHLQEALRIDELTFGKDGTGLMLDLSLLGQTLVHARRLTDAVPVLERAIVIGERPGTGLPLLLGMSRFFLARALWEGGTDRARARRLVGDARAVLGQLGDDPQAAGLAAAIDDWQAAHR